jgi:hypothetical protein
MKRVTTFHGLQGTGGMRRLESVDAPKSYLRDVALRGHRFFLARHQHHPKKDGEARNFFVALSNTLIG